MMMMFDNEDDYDDILCILSGQLLGFSGIDVWGGGRVFYAAMQFVDRGLRCTEVERRLNQSIVIATADANGAKSADNCQTMQ